MTTPTNKGRPWCIWWEQPPAPKHKKLRLEQWLEHYKVNSNSIYQRLSASQRRDKKHDRSSESSEPLRETFSDSED